MTDATRWYKPKLIEVAIPLEDINRESQRENFIYRGNPSALHQWWSRKPLATARAVLFAQLVDDPSAHPEQFPTEETQKAERERLHGIIKRLVVLDNVRDEALLKEAREEIFKSCDGIPPPVLDPFAGGGSIPLEAQRLGLEVHASDLNPVAVLINKAMIEIPPKWAGRPPVFPGAAEEAQSWPGATGLAEDVRRYGKWMGEKAAMKIGHLYPRAKLPDGTVTNVIAWIWVRTITCPNPACAGVMPLANKFWISRKKGKERYVEPISSDRRIRFEIRGPQGAPREGTVGRSGATCLLCGTPVPLTYVRAEGKAGRMSAQLIAIAAEGHRQRYYLPPDDEHEMAADIPRADDVPDSEIPHNPRYLTAPNYGLETWADLFTSRQLTALITFSNLVGEAKRRAASDAYSSGLNVEQASDYAGAISTYLAFTISKLIDYNCSLVAWYPQEDRPAHVFTRQAIPMVWDYAELNPFSEIGGTWTGCLKVIVNSMAGLLESPAKYCQVKQADASSLTRRASVVTCTDPPYYDNIGYADLADFFYVWLRRSLADVYPTLMGTVLTPKADELVADPFRHEGKKQAEQFFTDGFEKVFTQIRECTAPGYPISVFYAFKQTEKDSDGQYASTGWETLLEGLQHAGWAVTGTWPMRTERRGRTRDINSNALASSIVLACRPRHNDAGVTDKRGMIAALRDELPDALQKLQEGSTAPVDLPQAAIGPGMAVFSRYARVNEPDGSPMKVRTALALINQVLDEVLSQQEGDFGSDTRWCLEWFKSYGFDDGPFGVAETISKAKNTSIAGLERAGVLKSAGGKVRLLSVQDLPASYDPGRDDRVSEWEIVLHLAKRLSEQGSESAARLMAAARAVADLDAVRELAYLLFSIAEKRGWTETALLFNGLGTSWSELADEAKKPALASPLAVQDQLGYETG
jgi:putative DNA methylase